MKEIRLRNGSLEAEAIVATTMVSLQSPWAEDPILAFEVVSLARDPNHELFGNSHNRLRDLGFLVAAGEHSSVRNVILSAVSGNNLEMTLGHPLAPKEVSNA